MPAILDLQTGDPSERQSRVLDAALQLLVEEGASLTMTRVAQRAQCSKESLYKWFGDRDGLLTAIVQWQAAKVKGVPLAAGEVDARGFTASLEAFAADWLAVISGATSVALNRFAVGEAGSDRHDLGAIVLENGPFALARRLSPLLELGRRAGLLEFSDGGAAFRTFFGLVVRDTQIRLLLGDRLQLSKADIRREACEATRQFLVLFGTSAMRSDLPAPTDRTTTITREN